MSKTGIVFDIQHFSVNDGPGIRTTVFMKGCPLRCLWCHNPEGLGQQGQVFFFEEKCLHCGLCAAACPKGRLSLRDGLRTAEKTIPCTGCFSCAAACPAGALEPVGREMTLSALLQDVLRDRLFYETSGGGVTLSGGEPMLQWEFCLALAKALKAEGVRLCMETSGHCRQDALMMIQPYVDIFLFDYKLTGQEMHTRCTGADERLILKNLAALDAAGAKLILRCPIIPGVNMDKEHAKGIGRAASGLRSILSVQLEPYHGIGKSKEQRLGISRGEPYRPPTGEEMEQFREWAAEDCSVKIEIV